MMKWTKIITACLLFTAVLFACKKEELDTWNAKNRIWFDTDKDVVASFKKAELKNATELIAEIPLAMAGKISSSPLTYDIQIIKDKRNPDTRYEIIRPLEIASGASKGVLKVKIYRTNNLKVVADTLNFGLVASDNLEPGIKDRLTSRLIFTDSYAQPAWWYDLYCGAYTEAKHEVLFAVFGNDNDIRGGGADANFRRGWSHQDALYNLYLLNKYCEAQGFSFRFADGK